jgi:hypothetical protein
MKTLGISIRLVIDVDESMAEKFRKSPTGFLTLSGEPLGSEKLTIGVVNERPIEPTGIRIRVEELAETHRDSFLAE